MSADPLPNPPQTERLYEQLRKIGAHKRRLCAVIEVEASGGEICKLSCGMTH
jgi:hypothetical protein